MEQDEVRQQAQPRLRPPAALEQNQTGRSVGLVTHQLHPLGLQTPLTAQSHEIGQPFRPVDQETISAEAQEPGGSLIYIGEGAGALLPGLGTGHTGRGEPPEK